VYIFFYNFFKLEKKCNEIHNVSYPSHPFYPGYLGSDNKNYGVLLIIELTLLKERVGEFLECDQFFFV